MSAPQGILITAGKVHVPFKTELLGTLGSDKFAKRAPHLVGILATKKEDARTYAEVSRETHHVLSLTSQNVQGVSCADYL